MNAKCVTVTRKGKFEVIIMITLHDLLDNFCCIDPYTDYAIVNIETGEVLVNRVHDRTYTVDDVDDYAKFLPYARKQIRKWEAKDGKMIPSAANQTDEHEEV